MIHRADGKLYSDGTFSCAGVPVYVHPTHKLRSYSSASHCNADSKKNDHKTQTKWPYSHICVKTPATAPTTNTISSSAGWGPLLWLWPLFTPSILTLSLIQHNRPSVCLECHPLSSSASPLLSVPYLSLPLSIYIYLSISVSLPFSRDQIPPLLPHHTSCPYPCCLLPSAVSEFPRVRQQETITLRQIRSPPISPCLLLPSALCLSSSPSSSTFLFPRRQHAAFFFFFRFNPETGFFAWARSRLHRSFSPCPPPPASLRTPLFPPPSSFRQSV